MESPGRNWRWWLLGPGERIVGPGGAWLGAVFAGTLGVAVWWSARTVSENARRRDEQVLTSVGESLAVGFESLLNAGQLTKARMLVAETARSAGLNSARVVLPGGGVLADLDPASITEPAVPESWPTGAWADEGASERSIDLHLPGRGPARLIIGQERAARRSALSAEFLIGFGAIGVAGLGLWTWAYRRLRARLRGVGAVGDALRAAAGGELSTPALRVAPSFGPEAAAWNAVLSERDALRQRVVAEKAALALTGVGTGRGDGELAGACDALWIGLVIVDERSVVRYVNGAAAVLLGAPREELLGVPVGDAVKDEGVARAVDAAAGGSARQRTSIEVQRQAESGRGVIRFSVRALRREQSGAAMILVEDVTQQRVADESRNSFVTQVTHELRTPLTNIRLYLETLVDGGDADPTARAKCINVIGQEARRLERVVSDMLSVAEIEAGSLKLHAGDVRLDALFEEIEGDFRAQAQDREITLGFELPPKLPVIQGDRDKITLALHNLIGNALKYTPVGGKVMIHVETDAAGVSVSVIDNGIGIKPEEHELIFEKFYRAKDRRLAGITGSGLGLALARQVVRLHGGDIQVRSQVDKGSTFTITLPMGKAA